MPDKQEICATMDEEVTKQTFRKKIWNHIEENVLVNFPLKVDNRIPNFKGAAEAAQRILELDEFKRAKTIKVNPDKPQEPVRLLALEANKEILVPIPRLKSGLFLHVVPGKDTTEEELKNIATRRGFHQFGKPLGLDSNIKVDLLVLGAVCVSRSGYRIGKGEGFADLEFAVMMEMGAVDQNTTIITTVHDCQIVDDLPPHLFEKYDVPVDIIVTPTQTIIVNERLKKPTGIFWDILTPRRVKSMQILQKLMAMEEAKGKTIVLKEEDSNDNRRRYERRFTKKGKGKKNPRMKHDATDSDGMVLVKDGEVKESKEEHEGRRNHLPRRRRLNERKGDGDRESPVNENNVDETRKHSRRPTHMRLGVKANCDFSVKLTNIKSDVRVRHLKDALLKRGVRASDITWHGRRGYCYLHFGKLRNKDSHSDSKDVQPDEPIQVDSILANLQLLKLGESATTATEQDDYIVVELAKPMTRIEITDIATV